MKIVPPCLIMHDLNMPRMRGMEFLEVLRSNSALRRHGKFVMTTSAADEDRLRACGHNVAGCILKERMGQNFIGSISMLELFWRPIEFPDQALIAALETTSAARQPSPDTSHVR